MKEDDMRQNPLVRVYLLGQCRLERRRGTTWEVVIDASWQQRRVRSLLCCLLSHASRILGREQVMESLWPDLDIASSANRLNTAVHGLRQVLEPELDRPANSQVLRLEHDIFVLADQSLVWVDVDAFDELLHQSYATEDPWTSEQLLVQAAQLYQGEFFPEERIASWAVTRRNVLQRKWVGMLLTLADLYSAHSAFSDAIDVLERLLAVDPAHEAAVRRLMIALAQMERRTEAQRVYQRLVSMLQKLYGAEPLPETQQLYTSLRKKTRPLVSLSITSIPLLSTSHASSLSAHHTFPAGDSQTKPLPRSHCQRMIGREQEYAAICRVMLAIQEGEVWHGEAIPHLLLLSGEVGIGKTRLAEELSSFAQNQGWTIIWSKLSEQERATPYRAWMNVLQHLRERGERSEQEEVALAHLSWLLSVLQTESRTAFTQDIIVRETALKCLSLESACAPLLIVFDDVHWLDNRGIELLTYIVRHIGQRHILFVGTFRKFELSQEHALRHLISDLCREQSALLFDLQRLSNEQIMQMLASLPFPLANVIGKLVSGNPFFAEELARSLFAQDTAQYGLDALERGKTLPASITTVLERRLSQLSQECRKLLERVAALGNAFELCELLLLNTGHSEDEILDLLDEAVHAGILREEGMGRAIRYDFYYPLLAPYLYNNFPATSQIPSPHHMANMPYKLYPEQAEQIAALVRYHIY